MKGYVEKNAIARLDIDLDAREELIRSLVVERMQELPVPDLSEHVVATYFIATDGKKVFDAGKTIAYHQTTSIKHPDPNSLVGKCTGHAIDCVPFDASERIGIVRVAFPLAMLLDSKGVVYSTDLLHISAGAGVFALREFKDVKLVDLALNDEVLNSFPGPAFGPEGMRQLANFDAEVAFGTIIKPCTGITPEEIVETVSAAAVNPLFLFIKEDEDLLPDVPFCPLSKRVRLSARAIEKTSRADGSSIIYAPHIGANPEIILENARVAAEEGAKAIMFSQYYLHGCLRLVRDKLNADGTQLVIYGHNGGIDVYTHHIWREVLDFLARLDGMDIRQTGVLTDRSLLRPAGIEWRRVEEILSKPMGHIRPVMIARAGGLDQGNIVPNLDDISKHGSVRNFLLLAGSAINGFLDKNGNPDPRGGAEAMRQALAAYKDPLFNNSQELHIPRLREYAQKHGFSELISALHQRYGVHNN
jgi:ribulose-bisphosphate carboxylase large chain